MSTDAVTRADIAVVGGGAAGLMAACAAAEELRTSGGSVVLLEHMPRVGKKLLTTGNGRCNLTNTAIDAEFYHGGRPELIRVVLEEYGTQRIQRVFKEMGLLCRADDEGRVYPYSNQASAVLNTLRAQLSRLRVQEMCGTKVISLRKNKSEFLLETENGVVQASRVILACGGKAAPSTGSDGSGFSLAKTAGHTVTPLFPSLTQIKVQLERVKALKGLRCQGSVSLWADGEPLASETGEIQFGENHLSGICIFQLSRHTGEFFATGCVRGRRRKQLALSLDLAPEQSEDELLAFLNHMQRLSADKPAAEVLSGVLPARIGQEIVKSSIPDKQTETKKLSAHDLHNIAKTAKNWRFEPLGNMPWQNAQVTAGGVPLDEIIIPSLESRKLPGLYFAGEILDVDGLCGGYNLHWAWCTGLRAGKAAAESIKAK